MNLKKIFTCAAIADASLKPGNYASRARPSAPDGPHAPSAEKKNNRLGPCGRKLFARKAIKKAPRKPRGLFSERKVHAFRGGLGTRKMTTQSPRNKGQWSSVGPAQPKGKLRPIDTPRKRFPRNSEIE
jgi:hypothetical protein